MDPKQYSKISPEAIKALGEARNNFHKSSSSLGKELIALVELYISILNNCSYCIHVHTKEAMFLKIEQDKIDNLLSFETSDLFSKNEKIALKWARVTTNLSDSDIEERKKVAQEIAEIFNPKELVDLTGVISVMNAFNRMAGSLEFITVAS